MSSIPNLLPKTAYCSGHSRTEIRRLVGVVGRAFDHAYDQVIARGGKEEDLGVDGLLLPTCVPEPYRYLGAGTYRIVIGLCRRHVIKIDPRHHDTTENELDIWFGPAQTDPDLASLLCPILGNGIHQGYLWIAVPFCSPALYRLPDRYIRNLYEVKNLPHNRIRGLSDIGIDNLGFLNRRLVITDYGYPGQPNGRLDPTKVHLTPAVRRMLPFTLDQA